MGIYAINQSGSVLGNNTTQTGVLQPNLNAGVVTYQNNNAMNESLFTSVQNKSFAEDGHDDGSIGVIGAIKNFGKGIGKLFTGMFCDQNGNISLAQMAKTGLSIGAITLATMIPVIGPLVLPTLCIGGMLHGGLTFLNGLSTVLSAKTDAEAEQAWQDMGTGATEGVISYVGYKATGGIKQGWEQAKAEYSSFGKSTASVEPKPSGESTGTPKTEPKAEASATPKAEPVTEPPVAEPPVAPKVEPVTEPPVAEPPVAPKAEPVVEKPAMTMTDEARVQYNNIKAQIENSRPTVNSEMIDNQFATPKELTEMKAFYEQAEAAAPKAEPVVDTPVAEAPATPKAEPAKSFIESPEVYKERYSIYEKGSSKQSQVSMHHNIDASNPQVRSYLNDPEAYTKRFGDYAKTKMETIDTAFEQLSPIEKDCVAYRRVRKTGISEWRDAHVKVLEDANVGDVISPDVGYSYYGFEKKGVTPITDNNSALIETHFPKGAKLSRNLEHWERFGGELITPRGAQYKVVAKSRDESGMLNIILEYILPS